MQLGICGTTKSCLHSFSISTEPVCVYSAVSVVSNSMQPYRQKSTRLLCPWDSPGKNTGVGCHAPLQSIVLTQGSNPCLLHLPHWEVFRHWCHLGSPAPHLFNLWDEYSMWNAIRDESEAGTKISRRNINNLRYADDTTLMAESKEELKNLLMRVKEESEKVGLKLNIQKSKIMAPHGK